jgi:hypothetical protein
MRPASLREQLRSLLVPDRSRWKPMFMGLAGFAAGVGVVGILKPPAFVAAALVMLAMASWIVGAYAMIGYVRWFLATEVSRAEQEKSRDEEQQDR